GEGGVTQGDLLPLEGGDQAGVVLQDVGPGDDVDAQGFRQRLAGVQGFQQGQLVVAFAQDVHRAAQDARPLEGAHGGPDSLAGPGAGHGALEVVGPGAVYPGEDFAVGGVDGVEGDAGGRRDSAASDVQELFAEAGHGGSLE